MSEHIPQLTFYQKSACEKMMVLAIEVIAIHKSIETITSNLITDLTRPGCANNKNESADAITHQGHPSLKNLSHQRHDLQVFYMR